MTKQNKNKNPKQNFQPNSQKTPRQSRNFNGDARSIVWSFSLIDTEDRWAFHKIKETRLHTLLTKEFKNKEGLNWAQLQKNGSHNIKLEELSKGARKRLEDIKQDDLDELFSLRFSGKERLWGIRENNILKILWWDPEHEICPSPKKHT